MDKITEYAKLAKEVNQCHFCEKTPAFPYDQEAEHLVKCGKDGVNIYGYVNLWNLWQGNLDAEIMVIGMDYGSFVSEQDELDRWKGIIPLKSTDKCLKERIEDLLSDISGDKDEIVLSEEYGIHLSPKKNHLFFTNTANCYRLKKSTGEKHSGWLNICAYRYLEELIDIVSPKIIIVLGQEAFEALHCLKSGTWVCERTAADEIRKFSDVLKNDFTLILNNAMKIRVFPVYHPSAEARNKDIKVDSDKAWEKIKEYYKSEMPDC